MWQEISDSVLPLQSPIQFDDNGMPLHLDVEIENWCNQHGGTTCKTGKGGASAGGGRSGGSTGHTSMRDREVKAEKRQKKLDTMGPNARAKLHLKEKTVASKKQDQAFRDMEKAKKSGNKKKYAEAKERYKQHGKKVAKADREWGEALKDMEF